jgi:hypothetical protein
MSEAADQFGGGAPTPPLPGMPPAPAERPAWLQAPTSPEAYAEHQMRRANLALVRVRGQVERLISPEGVQGQVTAGAEELLGAIGEARRLLAEAESAAVRGLNAQGTSWDRLAALLGVTRQAAWKRFGRGHPIPGAEGAQRPRRPQKPRD